MDLYDAAKFVGERRGSYCHQENGALQNSELNGNRQGHRIGKGIRRAQFRAEYPYAYRNTKRNEGEQWTANRSGDMNMQRNWNKERTEGGRIRRPRSEPSPISWNSMNSESFVPRYGSQLCLMDDQSQWPSEKELVFIVPSPDYCSAITNLAWDGTEGRSCTPSYLARDSCESLCCGRGYRTLHVKKTEMCNCKVLDFTGKFICNEICNKTSVVHGCNK